MAYNFTPYIGGSVGNVMSDVHAGGIIRFGTWVNYFPSTIYKGRIGALPDIGSSANAPFVYYFLLGLEGGCLFNSFATEGNTFENTHNLSREPFYFSVYSGIGV